MNGIQITLIILAIVLFVIGAWPLSFIPLILLIPASISKANKKIKELQKEIETLKQQMAESKQGEQ